MVFYPPEPSLNRLQFFYKNKKPTGIVKVNPYHWINKGINCLWWPDEKSGLLKDISGGFNLNPNNSARMGFSSSKYNSGFCAKGNGNFSNGTSYSRNNNDCWGKGKHQVSIFSYARINTVDRSFGYDGRLLSCDTGTSTSDHNWMIGYTRNGAIRARIRTTNNQTNTVITNTNLLNDGDIIFIVGDFNGNQRRIRCFNTEGGIFSSAETQNASSGELFEDKNNNVAILQTAAANTNYAAADVFYSGTYTGIFTEEQCLSLLHNPYQFIMPGDI